MTEVQIELLIRRLLPLAERVETAGSGVRNAMASRVRGLLGRVAVLQATAGGLEDGDEKAAILSEITDLRKELATVLREVKETLEQWDEIDTAVRAGRDSALPVLNAALAE